MPIDTGSAHFSWEYFSTALLHKHKISQIDSNKYMKWIRSVKRLDYELAVSHKLSKDAISVSSVTEAALIGAFLLV